MTKIPSIVLLAVASLWSAKVCSAWTLPRVERSGGLKSPGFDALSRFNFTKMRISNDFDESEEQEDDDDDADAESNPAPIAFPKSPAFCNDCVCGTGRRTRIVGGHTTTSQEFPYVVGLTKAGDFHCGGSLITRRHVLTAAHCLARYESPGFKIYLGITDISAREGPHVLSRRIRSWNIHENFNSFTLDNDIAIIELDRPVPINGNLKTACLPVNRAIDYTGSLATAIGWGKTAEDADVSQFLRKVNVPVLSDEECSESSYPENRITDNMFCAGYLEGARDSCGGDSGGPLLVSSPGGHFEVIGLTSFGRGCAQPGFPGVYTKLTNYLGWIKDKLNGECICPSPEQLSS